MSFNSDNNNDEKCDIDNIDWFDCIDHVYFNSYIFSTFLCDQLDFN